MYEIHTIDTSGSQLVVPIENENRGGGAASNEPLDSFNPFSLSEDGSDNLFHNLYSRLLQPIYYRAHPSLK